jgi:hypothetical protein
VAEVFFSIINYGPEIITLLGNGVIALSILMVLIAFAAKKVALMPLFLVLH